MSTTAPTTLPTIGDRFTVDTPSRVFVGEVVAVERETVIVGSDENGVRWDFSPTAWVITARALPGFADHCDSSDLGTVTRRLNIPA